MKLLFDQNLSYRLCRALADVYPDARHVTTIGQRQAQDLAIWTYAAREDLMVVTLDSDFAELAALRGPPPKVLWLRCGNQPTDVIEMLLRRHANAIAGFADDPEAACLELY
ncbi:MAG TPA: DUF5615 family PIN-like protein [Rhizomicrobium sp.]|nr:DUF5615 family PIN-like protein [Rhizomicrobium sp.]